MTGRIPLWIDVRGLPATKADPLRAAAAQVGCEAIIEALPMTVGNQTVRVMAMNSAQDQTAAAKAEGIVIIDATDWTIIPLENLIAARRNRPGTLYALAASPTEAVLFRDTLEVGVHGVVLRPSSAADILETDRLLRARGPRPDDSTDAAPDRPYLEEATITRLEDAGPGDRVCIDTTSLFSNGEGILVGSTARSFCLVHAETIESEYVATRPFRVNAGAVHAYVLLADGKTQYLSEVQAGTRVTAVAANGTRRELTVGRAKIERRPHTLLGWTSDDGRTGHMVLQTAETIRLVRPGQTATSITELQVGDRILVHFETAARHFGMPVQEALTER